MPKSGSFLAVDASNIIVTAIKISEVGDDLIIRCVESTGRQTAAEVDLRLFGKKVKLEFRPCEIKTLRVNQKTGETREVNLLEE